MVYDQYAIDIKEAVCIVLVTIIFSDLWLHPHILVSLAQFPPEVAHAIRQVVPKRHARRLKTIQGTYDDSLLAGRRTQTQVLNNTISSPQPERLGKRSLRLPF